MKTKSKFLRPGFKSFLRYLSHFKLRFAIVITVFSISNIMLAVIPVFLGKLVGVLSSQPVDGHQAIIFAWILVGLSTFHSITWRISEYLYLRLVKQLSYEYENILFQTTIKKPYPYFVDKFTGKISSYITTLSQELREFIENLCYNYSGQLVSLIILGIILASINWQTGLIFIVGIVGMFVVGKHSIKQSIKYEGLTADAQSTKNGKIIDAIANFVNVKSFHKEHAETKSISLEQTNTLNLANKTYLWRMWFWTTMTFFVRDLMWPLTIGLNVYLFLQGQLTIAELTTVLSAVLLFTTTIWESIWHLSQFTLKLARVEEAHSYLFGKEILDSVPLITDAIPSPQDFTQSLSLKNLGFAYPDKTDVSVLKNISIEIKKGEKIGVVGKSGSGKTTLTKLLLGYYDATTGAIMIDHQKTSTKDVASLISYVPQDTSLFHRTIAQNISYATDRRVSEQEIVKAAKRAHADEFIEQIDEGYEALVGERGVKLSAGQRQRIAIARAFLDNKPILILDEATSALDSESEILVQEALEALWEDKTVIAIAHRLSTLRNMDRIIVIEGGTIIEQGSHKELIDKQGAYAKLWNHQSGGFLED